MVQPAVHPDLTARLPLVADVGVAGRVVADQNDGQSWRPLAGRGPGGDRRGDLRPYLLGHPFAVENLGRHVIPRGHTPSRSATFGSVCPDGPYTPTSASRLASVSVRLNSITLPPPAR